MSVAPSRSTAGELLPARSAREPILEIAVMSMVLTIAACAFCIGPNGDYRVLPIVGVVAGVAVLQHIGWAFGVCVPTLLGLYVIVIGRDVSADATTAARTRRTLGFVAEVMAAALAPALIAAAAACVSRPSMAGAALLVVPATALTLFLAIQLGGFIVFEAELRLASARRSRDWAAERLRTLRRRSRTPVSLVLVAHALVAATAAISLSLASPHRNGSAVILFLIYAAIGLGLGLVGVFGRVMTVTARDRTSSVLAQMGWYSFYIFVGLIPADLFLRGVGVAGWSVLAIMVLSLVSTFVPRSLSGRFILDWSISGAGARAAARSIAKTHRRSTQEVREILATRAVGPQLGLGQRIRAAVRTFHSTEPG